MTDPEAIPLNIEISASNARAEDVDRMTRQLQSELKEQGVESAELVQGGEETTLIGSLAITVLPAILPSVIGLIQAWATRGHGRTVKFKGKGIDFEGSPEDLHKLLAALEKGHHRLAGDSTTDAPPPKKG